MTVRILTGDCTETLRDLPAGSVQCCVTSPPYYGLRDYGVPGQIGLEDTPDAYAARLVDVFREVRRVLRDDGVLWLNLGDSYNNNPSTSETPRSEQGNGSGAFRIPGQHNVDARRAQANKATPLIRAGIKKKDLLGIPWMVAFALRADGWFLRSDCIWAKPNPMPESVRDRPTKAHEYVFLLTKSAWYFYDAEAIAEKSETFGRQNTSGPSDKVLAARASGLGYAQTDPYSYETRNARTVWTIATQPFSASRVPGWDEDHDHYAVMPPDLAERCILAGSRPGDAVLDPFGGAGTTGLVADRLGRDAILCELNPKNVRLARARLTGDAPLLAQVEV